ncbi:thiosulfate sulfurtransferase GlpE [Alteromonas flava]|uniref:thiosulfate sulfurtransferase GlpE n=1 Tax=Alteromonas flava TaxID=2048003 RepID=UPI000C286EB4|nr:thiosulfate sulfurtransferase GlpE [Alteromonas flava]
MSSFKHISPEQTYAKIENGETLAIADIRDYQSYLNGHMPSATHLNNETITGFMQSTHIDTPVIVVCYHGISSQQAAEYLVSQGYTEVYSMDQGFEGWRLRYPVESGV